ncbi:hypothetical protein [Saccharothrix saharensis]|uniref:hypothetical protein n=1 Tax=Saccharothrix saharensis TaxID=571190 RepID=UPI001151785C|nr:hypothetical protein [Saccharothrix saharensis]
MEVGVPAVDRPHPDLATMVGQGDHRVLGDGMSPAAQRNGDVRVRVGLGPHRTGENGIASDAIPFDDPPASRAWLIESCPASRSGTAA